MKNRDLKKKGIYLIKPLQKKVLNELFKLFVINVSIVVIQGLQKEHYSL